MRPSRIVPLTQPQLGLLLDAIDGQAASLHIEQLYVELGERLDPAATDRAWRELTGRHETLRTAYRWEGLRRPVSCVFPAVDSPIERVDLSADRSNDDVEALLARDAARGIDPGVAPTARLTAIKLPDERSALLLTYHHVALDGWSVQLLVHEFLMRLRGAQPAAPTAASAWRQWYLRQDRNAAAGALREALAIGTRPPRTVPPAPSSASTTFTRATAVLDEVAVARVRALSRSLGVTANAIVQAAWAIVLRRLTDADDVWYGLGVSCRPAEVPGSDKLVGMMMSTLPMVAACQPDRSIADIAREIHRRSLRVSPYGWCAPAEVRSWLAEGGARTPPLSSIVVFQHYGEGPTDPGGPRVLRTSARGARTRYAMVLTVSGHPRWLLGLVTRADRVQPEVGRAALDDVAALLTRGTDGRVAELIAQMQSPLSRLSRSDRRSEPTDQSLSALLHDAFGPDSDASLATSSLALCELQQTIARRWGIELPVEQLLRRPTAEQLEALIRTHATTGSRG